MNLDLKPLAVEFVRKHQCACQTPVELIIKAMEIGAAEGVRESHEIILRMRSDVAKTRKKLGQSFS